MKTSATPEQINLTYIELCAKPSEVKQFNIHSLSIDPI